MGKHKRHTNHSDRSHSSHNHSGRPDENPFMLYVAGIVIVLWLFGFARTSTPTTTPKIWIQPEVSSNG
jgi:hypothetical protein